MSKITFRADDALISQLEEYDASKSEVMREALRAYLGEREDSRAERDEPVASVTDTESIDDLIADRVDRIIADRLDDAVPRREAQDVNVNITIDGDSTAETANASDEEVEVSNGPEASVSHENEVRKTDPAARDRAEPTERKTCAQCGEEVASSHVYCPNCGEKASRRVFCDCGDELRSDWGFCPSCGRRTPAADVLDQT
ncbi:zinc ribbon domain-containing protein [Halomicroarcula sp. GCM10025324]|uniref:double zinc ribbon domain-containing protein n=1 Tax=Haloarcula TaxID=2237 RepID=UPI0023E7EB8C|nr:zinc ribbon domain-containing protein [Halomicroarcula sp. ZS-22-S1]